MSSRWTLRRGASHVNALRSKTAIAAVLLLFAAGMTAWLLFSFVVTDARIVLDYVRALVWPIVVLGVLYWARVPLLGKLQQLLRLDAFGASAEFSAETQTRRLQEGIRGDVDILLDAPVTPTAVEQKPKPSALPANGATSEVEEPEMKPVEDGRADIEPTSPQRMPATRRDLEARDSIESVIRKSAAWGYAMGRANAPQSIPDIEWAADGTWRIITEIPSEMPNLRGSPKESAHLRHVRELEDEIKNLDRKRYSSMSLAGSVQDFGWIAELKRRLARLDPGNPWAQDRF